MNNIPDRLWSMADTCTGHLNGGKYPFKDDSGFNLDNQALVFQVKLPKNANPS